MVEAKLLRKKLKNGLIVDKWDLVTIIEKQQAEIEKLRSWVEMLIEVPFFEEIDHYRGIPIAILKKAQEK